MKNTIILWRLELKRTIKLMPAMLLEAVLLLVVLAAIAFGVGKMLYQDSSIVQINVAIVEGEENPLTDLVINYVQGMESISKSCQFIIVTEEEGFSMLQEGKAAALLYLPDGMVEGIMNGNNVPVQVFFPKDAGIESALLKELTDAGVQMLRVAQAQIYGIYDTAKAYGALDSLAVLEADIDMYNLAFALDRLALFQTQNLSAAGSLTVLQYSVASYATFFLMLLGMACYPIMQPYSNALRGQLKRHKIGVGQQCFCKWLCGLCSMIISSLFFWFITKGILAVLGHSAWMPKMGVRQIGTVVMVLLCIATLIFMIFQIVGSGTAAILILFFLSTVMIYFSGGILPSVFLPQTVQSIGKLLPTTYLIEAAGSLYLDGIRGKTIGVLLLYTAVFGAASYGIRRGAEE